MKFTQLPADVQKKLTVNAGIIASDFNPATGVLDAADIIGATSGGVSVSYAPSYKDFGEDLDNCPKNTMELKQIESVECKMSGTFVTVTTANAKSMLGAADIDSVDTTKITPRKTLTAADFDDFWVIGDYSDLNGATNGGFVAIQIKNALSTNGFNFQSTDLEKGQFAFEYMGHMSLAEPDTMPMIIYIKAGTAESGTYPLSFASAAGTLSGDTALSGMTSTPGAGESYVYQTGYSLYVPAQGTVLAGTAWTAWNGSDDITAATGMDLVLAIVTTASGVANHAGKVTVVAKA